MRQAQHLEAQHELEAATNKAASLASADEERTTLKERLTAARAAAAASKQASQKEVFLLQAQVEWLETSCALRVSHVPITAFLYSVR